MRAALYVDGAALIARNTDWRLQRLQMWTTTARLYVRPYPCTPLNLHNLTQVQIREEIGRVLQIAPSDAVFTIEDHAGQIISADTSRILSKLTKDIDHAAYAGWMAETLRNPIEVWDRRDRGPMKRHYFSAYGHKNGNVVHYVAVAVTANGAWATSFHKRGGNGIDTKRDGDLIYKCY